MIFVENNVKDLEYIYLCKKKMSKIVQVLVKIFVILYADGMIIM